MSIPVPLKSAPAEDPTFARADAMVIAILAMFRGLSAAEREHILRKVTEALRPIPVPRAGDVLATVVQLIPRERAWTVLELKREVEKSGADIDDKSLYNAIGYLTRRHHIKRIGYGRYEINGMIVETTDDLGGQRSITEDDSDQ